MITISLDLNSDKPMYLQIYEYIKKEILTGRLSHPERLPSARALATHLEVSRSTVDTAYEQLVAEGYVDAKEKRGFFVNPITHTQSFSTKEKTMEQLETNDNRNTSIQYDFNPDAIDTLHFPYSIWKSIGKNQLDNPSNFLAGSYNGEKELRQAIASYLHGSRGVSCSPDQIIVGAGLSHLLQMLCVLFERKPTIAMEDPGYLSARQVLCSSGCSVINIPLKDSYLDVEQLTKTDANIVYATPSHQFPLGSVLPIARRQKLLSWAAEETERYIIEDDHDSEFRYKGKPIPALQSLDHNEKVIYIGTFSKAITPALRMGYMVLPSSLLAKYEQRCSGYACPVPRLTQAILNEFIQQGYFEKHLNRMRKIYKNKHDLMLEQIQNSFPESHFKISGDYAGLYIIIHYQGTLSEEEIETRAEKNGIRLRSLRDYYANPPTNYLPTYLLGFANLSEEEIQNGISILAKQVFLLQE